MTQTEKLREKLAQVYCLPKHSHKVLDPDLIEDIVSTILSAGYVQLSDVELDEEKINYDDSLMLQQVIFEHSLSDEQKAKKIEKMFRDKKWKKLTPLHKLRE